MTADDDAPFDPETHYRVRRFALADQTATLYLPHDWFWDTICLRVPSDWPAAERENPDVTGMFVIDDKDADRWTLWIDDQALSERTGAPLDRLRDGVNWGRELVRRDAPKARSMPT